MQHFRRSPVRLLIKITGKDGGRVNLFFNYDNQTFSIRDQALGICVINIHSGNDTINSMLELVPVRNDSMTITWHGEQETSSNPFLRLSRYRQAATSEKNMNKTRAINIFFIDFLFRADKNRQ